jgi:7-cyano-7-deazaguanine reductase
MGDTVKEAIDNYEEQVKLDIETVLRCGSVEIKFFNEGDLYQKQFPGEYYDRIENRIDVNSIQISDYHVNKNLLKVERSDVNSIDLYTNTLRSRCRHTKQKDTGSAYISMKFKQGYCINIESLYKYIVSYRMENEFHEFCAEQIYTDLMNLENVEGVSVMLLYSRRGSLDINPIRYSHQDFYNKPLECISINTMKTEGQ